MTLTPEVAFEQNRERLLSVIYLRMGPNLRVRMDPEDVLQEVAIEAVNSWGTLAAEESAGAWLVTLARRKNCSSSTHYRLVPPSWSPMVLEYTRV